LFCERARCHGSGGKEGEDARREDRDGPRGRPLVLWYPSGLSFKEDEMGKRLTPLRAIRLKCLDCCAGQRKEVRLCPAQDCPLWPFRFGKLPSNGAELDENSVGGPRTQAQSKSSKNPRKNGGV